MIEQLLLNLTGNNNWMPHGNCILWTPSILWTYVTSDALTALAYYSIPSTLIYIAWYRNDLQFRQIYLMFGAFILACGTTHILAIILLWQPIYWLDAIMHAITALLSIATATFLIRMIPLLRKSSLADLEKTLHVNLIKQHNIELTQTNARFNQTLELAPIGIINISTTGVFLEVNQGFCDFIGYSRDEILNMPFDNITCPACQAKHVQQFTQCLSGEISGFSQETQYQKKDGTKVWGNLIVKIIRHEDSTLDYFIEIIEDITIRKATEDKIKMLSLAVEQSPNPVMITDTEGLIEYVNAAFFHNTGYSKHEVIGQNPRFLSTGNTPKETYVNMWTTLKQGKSWRGELINKTKLGIEYIDLTDITPIKQADGSISHYLSLKEDITIRKQAELCLQESQQALQVAKQHAEMLVSTKARFIANMSHEIRTPISGIIGFSELALIKDMPANIRDYLTKINSASLGLLGILNDILDFSKLEAGAISLKLEPFDLSELKHNLNSLFINATDNKGLKFTIDITPETPLHLIGDELRLKQILINLLANAIKFTTKGAVSLTIALKDSDTSKATLSFCVHDSGIGMSEQDIAQLFQAFNQLDDSITRRFGGTGLGLSLSKELVQMMGSEFIVTSTLGSGSHFCFDLALKLASATQIDNLTEHVNLSTIVNDFGTDLAGIRILVAEDTLFNQQIIKELLSLSGIIVELANNGEEALALLQQQDFDAVLMDAHMPVMDGFEATRQIRSQARFAKLPIIALTAGVTPEERDRCMNSGMDDFINKPINIGLLLATLAKWLNIEGRIETGITATEALNPAQPDKLNVQPCLDVNILAGLIGDDPLDITQFLTIFQTEATTISAEIIAAIHAEQVTEIFSAAHKLKSTALSVGAIPLGNLCAALEVAGKANDLATINTLLPSFEQAWSDLSSQLEQTID
jgi:two-component system, sensor histidine kinase and response regulator